MNCSVVVKVSRRSVAFWYQAEGKRYNPLLMKGTNEVPLYFYVQHNQFDFGVHARERFYQHDPDAFGDYFELIKDPSRHFTLHNSPKRVKQLLYYGIEQFLAHFLNTVMYKSDSIEAYRGAFPLKFIFEPDLGEPERNLVAEMFREAGYRMVSVLSYNNLLLEHLRAICVVGQGQAALLLTGLDDTLYLDLYKKGADTADSGIAIPNQGADPRIRILAGMIVAYIHEQNTYLDLDIDLEVSSLLPYCAGLLTGERMILTGEVELVSGNKYWFRVNLKSVEDSLQYYSDDLMISTSINDLLQRSGIRREDVVMLLCSDQIRTPYFSERLLKQYPHVKSVEAAHKDGAMQLIFSRTSPATGTGPEQIVPKLPPALPPKITMTTAPAVKPPLPASKPVVTPVRQPPLPAVKSTTGERLKSMVPPPLPPIKKKS